MASLPQLPRIPFSFTPESVFIWHKLYNFVCKECTSNRINYNNALGEITCPNLVFFLIDLMQAVKLGNIITLRPPALN